MTDQMIQRAQLLMMHRKYAEAERVLQQLMTQDPNNVYVLHMYSEVMLEKKEFDQALTLASDAVAQEPDNNVLYHQRARIQLARNKYDLAAEDLDTAISLDPADANSFALYALLQLDRKQYSDALRLAESGLEQDPSNLIALNARSTALLKLGKKDASFDTIQGAFRKDPENAYTHANYGWGLLENGDAKGALRHFAEALRIDPSSRMAQQGMVEALKGKYLVYRLYLRYMFWMSNLTAGYQWAFVIGFFLASRGLNALSNTYPALQPFVVPLLVLLVVFAFSTWIIQPLGNLFLRFNQYGRYLLDKREILASNLVAGSLGVAIAGGVGMLLSGAPAWFSVLIYGLTMLMPLSVVFTASRYRWAFVAAGIFMGVTGALAILATAFGAPIDNLFGMIYGISVILFPWVINAVSIRANNP
ncbi:tetratricopeptide repeat protein [Chitinophaga lutea]